MNIKFKLLQMQNFKSVGDLITLDFQKLRGLNYIFGTNLDSPSSRNGSGKSTIADGITFALYGRTMKNTSNQYIANRYFTKKLKTYTKLYFEIDGVNYTSECFCKPHLKTVGIILKKFDSEINEWVDLTQSSVIKTKQYIAETVLNCSFDLFKSSIIISASECLNFYEGMTKQQKRSYIENIFNLNCFGIMFNMIKNDINDLKKEITYNNNQSIKTSNQLEQLKIKYNSYQQKLNKDIINIKNQMIDKCNQIKKLENKKKQYEIQCLKYQEQSNEFKKINTNIKTINTAKNTLQKQIIKFQSEITSIKRLIDQIIKIKQGLCQTCTQLINERYNFTEKINQIDQLNNNINIDNEKINKLNFTLEQYQKKNKLLEQNINNNNKKINEMNAIQISIKHLKEDIKRLKNQYDNLNNEQNNPFLELIKKTEDELNLMKQRTTQYHISVKHLDVLKQACSENGVKSFIIKDIVKLLNSLIQKYLNQIGAEYLVYFDETFDFKFITMSGECEYSNFSAGERQRIQIATVFAFRDLILNGKINSNIFIIDQFLDSAIDSICIKNVLEILYKKTIEQHQNIFIISHRQQTTENHIFNNIIEVIKQNGISRIKINN